MTRPGKKVNEIRKQVLVPQFMSEVAFQTAPMHERQKMFEVAKARQHSVEDGER